MKDCKPFKGCEPGVVGQRFGVNPLPYQPNGHTGLDIVKGYGTFLVAPTDVKVTNIVTAENFNEDLAPLRRGYGLVMQSLGNNSLYYLFWHCLPIFPVSIGQIVPRGKIVAQMGNSGFVTYGGQLVPIDTRLNPPLLGTHVHYEKFLEPIAGQRQYLDPYPDIDWDAEPNYSILEQIGAMITILKKALGILKK